MRINPIIKNQKRIVKETENVRKILASLTAFGLLTYQCNLYKCVQSTQNIMLKVLLNSLIFGVPAYS